MGNLKIARVPIPTPTLWPHQTTNCYIIGNDKESILVDAGYDQKETKTELEKALLITGIAKPKSIFLTHYHPDHAPGVKQLQDWDATIYCHSDEYEHIEPICEKAIIKTIKNEEIYKVDGHEITVFHTPGHTKGHISLYIPSKKTLIAGDNIVAEGTSWIGPPDGDMIDFLQTLERLKKLELTKIGPGHGDWVMNPYEHIAFVYKRRLDREAQIKKLLTGHQPLTVSELTRKIYAESIHPSLLEVAKRTTEAHLIKLTKEGIVIENGSNYRLKD